MDLNAVYKKTQKGQEEMAQRTVLGMRERTLLVMVDGKTTAANLLARAQHMPDPQGLLTKLVEGGFISAEASAAPTAPAAAPAAASPQVPAALTPQDLRIMQETMRYAERFLDAVLGQDADMLAVAIDKCKTIDQLRTQLGKTRDVIEGMGKKKKAEEFWNTAQALLEGQPIPATPVLGPQSAPAPAAAPAAPPPAAPQQPAVQPSPSPQPSMQEAARFARRYLLDSLGPDGDSLVEAIEKCKTLPELRARLEKTRETLESIGSKRKAGEFWEGVQLRLPAG
ncbi:MAG: hypothetical protein IPG33_02420 [Betaproteobacteria bacterium]|jgi:hypothetical protein|nr:hypothetical protein [Betaproteobacteria bacterium]